MVPRACNVETTTERVVLSSCLLLLLFPSSNTLTHGSHFHREQLNVCYLLFPSRLATPPGFHVTYIPKVNLLFNYQIGYLVAPD